eukprot:TRINITY_DN4593_c1_g1_i2.p2 TRINITY_DN4593_c1_g1~~TRINITY_DN4593_c1_g1_i2.p2  ORF type:complete len:228 (-),score=-24.18 TRINITY_DN4593_c1_g1_i2:804-1487(-)
MHILAMTQVQCMRILTTTYVQCSEVKKLHFACNYLAFVQCIYLRLFIFQYTCTHSQTHCAHSRLFNYIYIHAFVYFALVKLYRYFVSVLCSKCLYTMHAYEIRVYAHCIFTMHAYRKIYMYMHACDCTHSQPPWKYRKKNPCTCTIRMYIYNASICKSTYVNACITIYIMLRYVEQGGVRMHALQYTFCTDLYRMHCDNILRSWDSRAYIYFVHCNSQLSPPFFARM